ncbi:hypothetical protein GUITHDRAFT_110796 [Guillardia theta CCMP2712]|uniref:LisH domain-containing protein n=1 Tax=Guillardia theta (strain CCMP2712) TaxID=905079 RepID=L1J3I0_GUITC|nr:hypothetical protein GUITHDRAFT_110796 [Guillardia theta CCMP2712]EKX43071.1 hypothetical protein GUITHDRAFT_110796 [Guillardia theta CCMP2712]|eukprot:XP_005830051.1 hypothetical protein GUITHDRAFT_110796 [Guillardia theta CCMP2712]
MTTMGDTIETAHIMKLVQCYLEDCKLDITQKTLEKELQKKFPEVSALLAQNERPEKFYLQELIRRAGDGSDAKDDDQSEDEKGLLGELGLEEESEDEDNPKAGGNPGDSQEGPDEEKKVTRANLAASLPNGRSAQPIEMRASETNPGVEMQETIARRQPGPGMIAIGQEKENGERNEL